MKRDTGIVAGLAAVLMIFGLTGRQTQGPVSPSAGSSGPASTSGGKKVTAKSKRVKESPRRQACDEIVDELRRFVENAESGAARLPDSCYEPDELPAQGDYLRGRDGVTFGITTVPDPVSTHLPLFFDRAVESIQQAVQDDGYSYEGSWFPWDVRKDYAYFDDQQEADNLLQIQQAEPGVMVFRPESDAGGNPNDKPYERGLVIFLVGEQPTAGLSDDQFDNASTWIHQLSQDRQKNLPILGPTFSGSLPSLKLALRRNLGEPDAGSAAKKKTAPPLHAYLGQKRITVSSGTVSSYQNYENFQQWIDASGNGSFIVANENDALLTDRFCRYLTMQGYRPDLVAELSEDETAFGALGGEKKPCPALSLYYPRDIASVRSAYEEQSLFGSAKPQSNPDTPSTRLRGNLSEPPGSENDSVRHYGGSSTPMRQEATLAEIARQLAASRIQFIILRSTNSLDQIFLSEFLRRYYPEGRVVIDGADLLFTEGSWGSLMRGVMVLSPYPLLTHGQDWTSSLLAPRSGAYWTFGADTSEETYIAARELFRRPGYQASVPIHDYSPPAWALDPDVSQRDNELPPTWLTVIGHRQFWPIAALNGYTLSTPPAPTPPGAPKQQKEDAQGGVKTQDTACTPQDKGAVGSILPVPSCRGDEGPFDPGNHKVPEFPIEMWVLLIACLVWASFHFLVCGFPSIVRPPRARTYFAPLPCWEHPALVAFGGLLLVALALTVAGGSGWIAWREGTTSYEWSWTGPLLGCSVVLITLLSLAGTILNYRVFPLALGNRSVRHARVRQLFALVAAALCGVLVLSNHKYLAHGLTRANTVAAYWRNVNLMSGVSGLIPQLLLIAALYAWFWCRLRGLAHLGGDRPLLPPENQLPPRMLAFSREGVAQPVEEAAGPLEWRYVLILAAAFAFTVACSFMALQGETFRSVALRTVGERRFGSFMFWWVCLSIAVILANAVQLWRVWGKLRPLLIHLDRLPARRTLRALKGLSWGSIWKVSGNVLEERYRMITLQVESLRHLENRLALLPAGDPSEEERFRAVFQKIESCLTDALPKLGNWYVELQRSGRAASLDLVKGFQKELAATAGLVMENILLPAWQSEKDSLIFDYSKPNEKSQEEKGKKPDTLAESGLAHVRAAEEFFVLPYVAFIQNTLGQMRTIILGTLWLFVGTTLAFASYPFQPLNVLGAIFLTVFVLVGGVTVVVYAQMCRDATLSHITATTPGELGWDFWLRLGGFGIGPLLGLLTTLFPSISDLLFSWFQPGMQSLK